MSHARRNSDVFSCETVRSLRISRRERGDRGELSASIRGVHHVDGIARLLRQLDRRSVSCDRLYCIARGALADEGGVPQMELRLHLTPQRRAMPQGNGALGVRLYPPSLKEKEGIVVHRIDVSLFHCSAPKRCCRDVVALQRVSTIERDREVIARVGVTGRGVDGETRQPLAGRIGSACGKETENDGASGSCHWCLRVDPLIRIAVLPERETIHSKAGSRPSSILVRIKLVRARHHDDQRRQRVQNVDR